MLEDTDSLPRCEPRNFHAIRPSGHKIILPPEKKATHKPVKLNAGAGRKLDFLRVLVALHEAGYFTDEAGGQIDRKDVFAAFGEILDLGLGRANANLSEGLNHYNQDMTAEIFKAYVEYENEVLERRKYR